MSSKKSAYQDYALKLARSETPYYQLKESICQFLEGDMAAAGVFAYIKNRLRRIIYSTSVKAKHKLAENDFWFICPGSDVEQDLNMTRPRRTKAYKRLQKIGLIETELRGLPAQLWVRINLDKEEEIDDWYNEKKVKFIVTSRCNKTLHLDVTKSDTLNKEVSSNEDTKKERRGRCPPARARSTQSNNGKPQFFDEFKPPKRKIKSSQIAQADKPYYAMYKQLRHALRVNKRSVSTEETANSAISHFKKLCRDVGQERVQNVLDWYSANCTIEKQDIHGLPGVSCAKHFCRHFEWIDKARRDATGASSKKSPKMKQTTDGWVEA